MKEGQGMWEEYGDGVPRCRENIHVVKAHLGLKLSRTVGTIKRGWVFNISVVKGSAEKTLVLTYRIRMVNRDIDKSEMLVLSLPVFNMGYGA